MTIEQIIKQMKTKADQLAYQSNTTRSDNAERRAAVRLLREHAADLERFQILNAPAPVGDLDKINTLMRHEVAKQPLSTDIWNVEAIDHNGDGEVYVTTFSGPDAYGRAKEYADWKNGQDSA